MFMRVGKTNRIGIPGGSGNARPSLDLSFTNNALDSRITFTRASSATYFDATGTMQTAGTNVARFDYDPVTLAPRGLLIEETRTNSMVFTNNIPAGVPTYFQVSNTNVVNAGTAPDGTATACFFSEDASALAHSLLTFFPMVVSSSYALSFYAKAGTRRYVTMAGGGITGQGLSPQWDLLTGTDFTTGTSAGFSHGIQNVGGGWYRCWVVITASATIGLIIGLETTVGGGTTYQGDGTSGLYIWGVQIELGSFITSYIPTPIAATVTRAAETAIMPVGSWFKLATSSYSCEFVVPNSAGIILTADDTTANNVDVIRDNGGLGSATTWSGGGNDGRIDTGAFVANIVTKVTYSASVAARSISANGSAVVTNAVTTTRPTSITRFVFGTDSNGLASMNGWLRRVRYWPRALTNVELQNSTS